jgi:hypothetical protein
LLGIFDVSSIVEGYSIAEIISLKKHCSNLHYNRQKMLFWTQIHRSPKTVITYIDISSLSLKTYHLQGHNDLTLKYDVPSSENVSADDSKPKSFKL